MTRATNKTTAAIATPRQRRAGAGPSVSLRRLSKETGLSLSHVSRVFSGQRQPSIRAARLLCAILKVDIESLLQCLPCRPHQVHSVKAA